MKIGGIVVAAGKSTRMGLFKPLLPLKEATIIENSVHSLLLGGVDKVVVVTGKNAEKVERVLKKYPVMSIRNAEYETKDMFSSVKIGLKEVTGCDAIFFLPGDCPNVSSETIVLLKETFLRSGYDVYYPCFEGKKGHPPLIRRTCYQAILEYEGNGGLKQALSLYHDTSDYVETGDEGCVTDLDYTEDYEKLLTRLLAAHHG